MQEAQIWLTTGLQQLLVRAEMRWELTDAEVIDTVERYLEKVGMKKNGHTSVLMPLFSDINQIKTNLFKTFSTINVT